ncbi:MAG TPA: response regulator [Gemmatimonadaceae bacterium]|nr:response regulator [Gemmatimonadaceae bacterium]
MIPHVLIVEDSTLVIGALRLLLEETGHRVSAATTVREAVDAARAGHPDVVLLDITLQRESGFDVLADLARTNDLPPVTVAMTGHDEPEVRQRCMAAGCRDVLVKPIAAMELPGRIRDWLKS